MPGLSAEQAYVFRHALLRAAAYELQLPAERAALHRLAAGLIEAVHGPDPARLAAVAGEIADHLRAAGQILTDPRLREAERRFTLLGAKHAEANWDHGGMQRLYGHLADIGNASEQSLALQMLFTSLKQSGADDRRLRKPARRLLRLARENRNAGVVAKALTLLGVVAPPGRRNRLERVAYRTAARAQVWLATGLALGNMGVQCRRDGNLRKAAALLRRAILHSRRAGNTAGVGYFQGALAGTLHEQGKSDEALALAREGVVSLKAAGGVGYLPFILRVLAAVCADKALWQEADDAYRQIGAAFETMRQFQELAFPLQQRALLQLEQGNVTAARELWAQGLAVVHRHGTSLNNAETEERMRRRCAELGIPPLDTA